MFAGLRGYALCGLLCLLAACGGGGTSDGNAGNEAPAARILVTGEVRTEDGALHGTVGAAVEFDASGSSDPESDALTFDWTLASGPPGSAMSVSGSASTLSLRPDVLGSYIVRLRIVDSRGASTVEQVTVVVDNVAPSSNVVIHAAFTAVPAQAPTQSVTVGGSVLIDATGATDPDGDPVDVTYELLRPSGSAAALSVANRVGRFAPDIVGLFQVRVRGTDGKGGYFETLYSFEADNRVPSAVVVAGVQPATVDGGTDIVTTSVGYVVLLNGGSSSDPDNDTVTRTWTLAGRPAGSGAALQGSGTSVTVSPDALGDYTVVLTVTDSRGAAAVKTTVVRADNRSPVAVVTSNATPQALPSAPSIHVPPGTEVTLRADASTDADGDALTYAWSIDAAPTGSAAALSSSSSVAPSFTADVEGSYVFRLRVSDPGGAYSERMVTLQVGSHAPVAVVDRGTVTVVHGDTVQVSAGLSFDEDGDALTFDWSIDARPGGSTATLDSPTTAAASFDPDADGVYVLSVRVSDGTSSSVAYVTVRVLATFQNAVALGFRPEMAHYSVGLDKVVISASNPNSLRIVDPFVGTSTAVVLPAAVKNFGLSPDGRLAAVLHEGVVTLVDLAGASIVRSTSTMGSQTDAFVTNDGVVYLIGQTGGQWVGDPVVVIDGYTGTRIAQGGWTGGHGFAYFYGTQYGVLAGSLNKVFFVAQGLSPSDISWFSFNPSTSQLLNNGDSPYHGDFSIYTPLWMSGDDGLVFTAAGTYFRSSDLQYAGQLQGVWQMYSFSHSAQREEALALLADGTGNYPSSYGRFTGSLLFPDTPLPLPEIGGEQSYGIKVFHGSGGAHVVLVQTGGAGANDIGLNYHVIAR